jgi:hypothetical protein
LIDRRALARPAFAVPSRSGGTWQLIQRCFQIIYRLVVQPEQMVMPMPDDPGLVNHDHGPLRAHSPVSGTLRLFFSLKPRWESTSCAEMPTTQHRAPRTRPGENVAVLDGERGGPPGERPRANGSRRVRHLRVRCGRSDESVACLCVWCVGMSKRTRRQLASSTWRPSPIIPPRCRGWPRIRGGARRYDA